MARIFARPRTVKSARLLGYPVYQNQVRDPLPGEAIIKWGNSSTLSYDGPILNDNVRIATNKLRMHQAFQAGDVPSPRLFERDIPVGVDAVIRPVEHQGGEGFMRGRGPLRIPEGHYATEYLENVREYRVFFVGDEKFNVCRARRQGDDPDCRSQWDYWYCGCGPRISRVVDQAKEATGLDFGAVDILDLTGSSDYRVLEVNTAPALDDARALDFMSRNIDAWVEDNEDEDVTEYSRTLHRTREMRRNINAS